MGALEKVLENKKFKKISLVSSAAFSAASYVCPWMGMISAPLGLYASYDREDLPKLEKDFAAAVDAALDRTQKALTTASSKKIIPCLHFLYWIQLRSNSVHPKNGI